MSLWNGPTLEVHADHARTLDQTRLPFEVVWLDLTSLPDCLRAIDTMQVRGAPLIGVVAAFGLAFAAREDASESALAVAMARLRATRPTAVNLQWALEQVHAAVRALGPQAGSAVRARQAWGKAVALARQDIEINAALGGHGLALILERVRWRAAQGRPVRADAPLQLLTHCNAGRLATVDHGTALAPIYRAVSEGIPVHVWVDETRPRNQGANLTAWELMQAGVACTVVADNAGGWLMQQGRVDAVIVGCDRVAANGDVANKIGTLLKALAACDAGLPFWVACPTATLDLATPTGQAIRIEMRTPREVTHMLARSPNGEIAEVALMAEDVCALNPAFDVTPARLVTALITERGCIDASGSALRTLMASILDQGVP